MRKLPIIACLVFFALFLLALAPFTSAQNGSPVHVGQLITAVEDNFDGKTFKEKYFLQTPQHRVFGLNNQDRISIPPGSTVRVKGTPVKKNDGQEEIPAEHIELVESSVAQSNPISGTNRLAVIMVNFNNLSVSSPTNAQVKSSMDSGFTPFMAEMSFNNASFPVDVYGWVTMNTPATCDIGVYGQPAITAADSLVNYNNYKYVMVVFPNNTCSYGGVAYYPPGVTYQTGEGAKTIQLSALPHNYILPWGRQVGAHELGHSMGLKHANGWECGTTSIGPSCTSTAYADHFDVMGYSYTYGAHYGAYNKEFLQWVPSSSAQLVTQSGTYTVQRVETATTGIQSLKIPREGTSTYYNVENRTAILWDQSLPSNAVSGGLLKIIANTISGIVALEPNIIDSSPNSQASNDFNDGGWTLGSTFTDSERGLTIQPVSKSNGVLSVAVNFFAPTLLSPAHNASLTTLRPIFDWTDITYRTNYSIQVARDSAFTNLVVNTTTTSSQYTPTSDLPSGVLLYWRVRANYSFGSSVWSGARVVTVGGPTPTPTPTSVTLYPTADALVSSEPSSKSKNFGTSTTLSVDGLPVSLSYMKFNLTSLAGRSVTNATLRIRVTNGSTSTQVLKQTSNSWTETGITYNNRPSLGASITSVTSTTAGTWKDINITAFVNSTKGTTASFGIDSTGADDVIFSSRDSSVDRPHVIVY